MHAIDSRRVAGAEKKMNTRSFSEHNNVSNGIFYNVTDGTINFVGNEDRKNGCVEGGNVFLTHNEERSILHGYKPELTNISVMSANFETGYVGHNEKGLEITDDGLERVRQLPCYEGLKTWFTK